MQDEADTVVRSGKKDRRTWILGHVTKLLDKSFLTYASKHMGPKANLLIEPV